MNRATQPKPDYRPTLILIHGATLNGHMWDTVCRDLDPRLCMLTPDLPGHGAYQDLPYTLLGAVETIVETAKSVAPAPVVLVGDSLGAYTAMAAASALPADRLRGLVLGGATFNFFGSSVFPYVARGAIFNALCAVFGEQRVVNKLFPKSLKELDLDPADGKAMLEAGISITVFSEAVRALRPVDFRGVLAKIEQPVLLVNGDRDKVNIREEDSFLAVAQDANSHRCENCEHGVSIRRHKEFAELVNTFAHQVFPELDTSFSH